LDDYEENRTFDQIRSVAVRYLKAWNFDVVAEKLEECSEDYAVFECNDCGQKFSAPITCGLRVCPSCRSRLRADFVEELKPLIKGVSNHRHLVLSVPNLPKDATVSDLKRKIREIKKKFGKLRRRKYFDERVNGTIYGLEVKQTGNGFNIHLHVFMALKPEYERINYEKVVNMWTDDYFPEAHPSAQEFRQHRNTKTALVEVVSYATKGAYFLSGKAMAKWVVATKGSRLVGRTGIFHGASTFTEKEYMECPFCGSKDVDYLGKWSEMVRFSVKSDPPPTINEIKGGE
jgi:DNA-directed RNA polymerase subunit RPC12/RpoP